MQNIAIRLATRNDISRINELFIQMIQYVNEQNKKSGKPVDEETFKNGYEDGFLEIYLSRSDKFILVAELDGQVVAYLSCEEKERNSNDSFIYLDDFCVDSDFRGYGIGTQLINKVQEYAIDNCFANLRLHVENENLKALNFYTNLGFIPILNDKNRTLMQKGIVKENKRTI